MIFNLGEKNSVLNQFMAEIRDQHTQTEPMRFRRNLERMGEIFAYEISQTLNYEPREVTTPLGTAVVPALTDTVVIASVLRAGLPMHNGMLNYFDKAESAFITAYRKYTTGDDFTIELEYVASPFIDDKVVILCDPMLATGASIVMAFKSLYKYGTPKHIHIVSLIASRDGVEYIKHRLPARKYSLWVGAVDEELTVKAYIVPGLGDAGDLAYGKKS